MSPQLNYFITSLKKRFLGTGLSCPSCGDVSGTVIARKWIVTSLVRCHACQLQYRAPVTTFEENAKFYQEDYSQGFTSDVPDDDTLKQLKETGFKSSPKNYGSYVEILQALGMSTGSRVFDFGCSWGYGSWQLNNAGFQVDAYEISQPRALYAREKLDVNVLPEFTPEFTAYDVFFSSHVLEHVPSLRNTIDMALKSLKPGGYFVGYTPNGSSAFKQVAPGEWDRLWGMVHPNFLDDEFYVDCFRGMKVYLGANPYDTGHIAEFASSGNNDVTRAPLAGAELMVIAQKPT